MLRRRSLPALAAALAAGLALLAGVAPATGAPAAPPAPPADDASIDDGAAPPPADDASIDDGAAPPNLLDPSLLPPGVAPTARTPSAKGVEAIRSDGSSGFRPFNPRAYSYGGYRFQLVSSGADGDVERLRAAVQATATELTELTAVTFTVDPGQVPRPATVNRYPGCDHRCSFFDDADAAIGVIRVGFASSSPCGPLVPSGVAQGTVGCGGPESIRLADGTVVHLRGNLWLSPSLADANAGRAHEIVAHEVGHALGLDHYEPAFTAVSGGTPVRQLMYPSVHRDASDTGRQYRSGDRNGVWWLQLPEAWYVSATYQDFLGRIPDTAGYHFWTASDTTLEQYVDALTTSDEWVGRIVTRFYTDVFGRAPDPGGFAYWTGLVRAQGVPAVAGQLYGSDEYLTRQGGTTTGVVQAMYRQLLGRDPAADPEGVAYWVAEAGRSGRVAVATSFFQSREKRLGRVRDLYCSLLNRPPDPGGQAYWADVILARDDLVLARDLATSAEYLASADEFALLPPGTPAAPGC